MANYRSLLEVERRFRVLKDFLHLRPVRHWTEPASGRMRRCASALIARALRNADVRGPGLEDQHLGAERALCELGRIRAVTLTAGERTIDVVTRRTALQARILAALGVETRSWERPRIS